MKTSLVIPIALFAIFTISEISCEETCVKFNYECMENSDCCSQNCYMSGYLKNRVCLHPTNVTYGVKVQNGWCSYNKSFYSNSSDDIFNLLGVTAAHAMLPVGSRVEVMDMVTNKTLDVTINTFLQPNNNTLLELSKEAADWFGIKDGGGIPCSVYLYKSKPDYSSIKNVIGFSASFFVVVFIVMSFL